MWGKFTDSGLVIPDLLHASSAADCRVVFGYALILFLILFYSPVEQEQW